MLNIGQHVGSAIQELNHDFTILLIPNTSKTKTFGQKLAKYYSSGIPIGRKVYHAETFIYCFPLFSDKLGLISVGSKGVWDTDGIL